MLFEKSIQNMYKKQLFNRCDDTKVAHYFSYQDFEGLTHTPDAFVSSKGYRLQGYFYAYENYNKDLLIIFDHGFGGGHRSYMKEINLLCKEGYQVYAYDHTGCMESEGDSCGGLSQSLVDLNDCINHLKPNHPNFCVIGHSWGGYAALNIGKLHPDVRKVVGLAAPISVKQMIDQNFSGLLKGYRSCIYELEKASNPNYINFIATDSTTNTLAIYDENDEVVKKEFHYDLLNTKKRLTKQKGHNPNYTKEAALYLQDYQKQLKKAKLKTNEDKDTFRNSFDWHKMTEQDLSVWKEIFDFLKEN